MNLGSNYCHAGGDQWWPLNHIQWSPCPAQIPVLQWSLQSHKGKSHCKCKVSICSNPKCPGMLSNENLWSLMIASKAPNCSQKQKQTTSNHFNYWSSGKGWDKEDPKFSQANWNALQRIVFSSSSPVLGSRRQDPENVLPWTILNIWFVLCVSEILHQNELGQVRSPMDSKARHSPINARIHTLHQISFHNVLPF